MFSSKPRALFAMAGSTIGDMGHSVAISCLLAFFLGVWILRRQGRQAGEPPGAFTDKSGRAMKRIRGDTRVRRFTHGSDISDQGHAMAHGDPYIIRNGRRNEVVLCQPEHLRDFFAGDSRDHWKAPDGNMGYFFHRLLGQCVGAQSGAAWRRLRAVFDAAYTPAAMAALLPRFGDDVGHWLRGLAGSAHDGLPFEADVSRLCGEMPLKLVAWTLYGSALTDEAFGDLMELVEVREKLGDDSFLNSAMISRFYAMLPTRSNRQLERYAADFAAFNMRMASTAEEMGVASPIGFILRETDPQRMREYLHTIDEILFENLGVASSAVSYLLLNLATHPPEQDRVRREAADAADRGAYLGRRDSYLEACCAESRRLCPAVWFTFCERSPSDKVIGGFYVPANSDVAIDWKRINMHAPVWTGRLADGRSVDGFDYCPERWARLARADTRNSLVEYGAGARRCLGQHFGSLLMRLVAVEVLSRYRISARLGPYELGFRTDSFVVAPKSHQLVFEPL